MSVRHKVWTTIGVVVLLGFAGGVLEDDAGPPGSAATASEPPDGAEPATVTATTTVPPGSRSPSRSPETVKPPKKVAPPSEKPKRPEPKRPKPVNSSPRGVPAGAQAAVVLSIADGDTLHLRAERPGRVLRSTADTTVRLLEIDTPETVDPSQPVACYGPAASAALGRLAPPGSKVWVLPDQQRVDPYGRLLLYLWSRDKAGSTFVNLSLVRGGFAKAVLYEPNDRYINVMRRAERNARAADRGLWGHCPSFGAPLSTPSPKPSPRPFTPQGPGSGGRCASGYDPCVPPYPPDVDCADVGQKVRVTGSDPHGLDADGDGYGCDS